MVKVLLVEPHDPHKGQYSFTAPSLGVWRICGFLRRHHIECQVFSPNLCADTYATLKEWLEIFQPTIVGFSLTGMTLPYDLALIHWAKSLYPNHIAVGGGIGATFEYETVLSMSPADYCIAGEGERPMLELCTSLQKTGHVREDIGGLIFRKNGRMIMNPNPFQDDATFRTATFSIPYDEMPITDYWDRMMQPDPMTGLSSFKNEEQIQELRSIRIMTLSHCPLRCAFCSYTNFRDFANNKRTRVVALSTDDVMALMLKVIRLYPSLKTIIFQDDSLSLRRDGERLAAICAAIIKNKEEGLIPEDLSFIASNRLDLLERSQLEIMKRAGFRLVGYGIESFSRQVLREYNKEMIYDKIDEMLHATLEAGIRPFLDIILASPDSTVESSVYTLHKCIEYIEKGCEVSIYPTVIPFAGSLMAQDPALKPLIRYEYVPIPKTDLGLRRGVSIEPRSEALRDFLKSVGERSRQRVAELAEEYGVTRFPSRLRSLIFIASAIDVYPDLFLDFKDMITDKIRELICETATVKVR